MIPTAAHRASVAREGDGRHGDAHSQSVQGQAVPAFGRRCAQRNDVARGAHEDRGRTGPARGTRRARQPHAAPGSTASPAARGRSGPRGATGGSRPPDRSRGSRSRARASADHHAPSVERATPAPASRRRPSRRRPTPAPRSGAPRGPERRRRSESGSPTPRSWGPRSSRSTGPTAAARSGCPPFAAAATRAGCPRTARRRPPGRAAPGRIARHRPRRAGTTWRTTRSRRGPIGPRRGWSRRATPPRPCPSRCRPPRPTGSRPSTCLSSSSATLRPAARTAPVQASGRAGGRPGLVERDVVHGVTGERVHQHQVRLVPLAGVGVGRVPRGGRRRRARLRADPCLGAARGHLPADADPSPERLHVGRARPFLRRHLLQDLSSGRHGDRDRGAGRARRRSGSGERRRGSSPDSRSRSWPTSPCRRRAGTARSRACIVAAGRRMVRRSDAVGGDRARDRHGREHHREDAAPARPHRATGFRVIHSAAAQTAARSHAAIVRGNCEP